MSDTPSQVLEQLQARYRIRFSGYPRISRDPDILDDMLAQLDQIEPAAQGDAAVLEQIAKDRELYTRERQAIDEARAVPGAIQGYRLARWGELCAGRYQRSFGGLDRATRDLELLGEVRSFLQSNLADLQAMDRTAPHLNLSSAIEHISRIVSLATNEADRIRTARTDGSQADQGTRYAKLANDQFALYQQGFAGRSRLSRHIPRLERIIRALEGIGAGMARLQRAGFASPQNDGNLKIVAERVNAYRTELAALTEAQQGAEVEQRVNALGAAANELFGEYREHFAGKPRSQADENLLNAIIEQLWAIALEMDRIDQDDGNETNERNLALVLDNVQLYKREFDAIREAKADA
ncbi:MAG: hypothetical protein KTR31_00400 [Myxococcales bacterium]|nr:hypothetical protein [Myxococcales bacterium]